MFIKFCKTLKYLKIIENQDNSLLLFSKQLFKRSVLVLIQFIVCYFIVKYMEESKKYFLLNNKN